MDWKVDVAVGTDATELLGNVVDHGLAAVVEVRLAEIPGLRVADHGVELVDGGDEGELGVFEDFGVAPRQLLVFHLLSYAGCADEAVVLASLTGEFAVTLTMLVVMYYKALIAKR